MFICNLSYLIIAFHVLYSIAVCCIKSDGLILRLF